MDIDDLLKTAESLNSSPSKNEATLRIIVGRAYYYAFHLCKNRIESAKSIRITTRENIHSKIIHLYAQGSKSQFRSIKMNLNSLRESRTSADYNLVTTFDQAKADLAIMVAKRISTSLNSLNDNDFDGVDSEI